MIYAAASVGLLMAGAALAPEPCTAAVATPSESSRRLLFKGKKDGTEGRDEGDEGNEGLDDFRATRRHYGYEGNEGDEGDEGHKVNEGNEGNEGGSFTRTTEFTVSSVTCTSQARAQSFSAMKDAHIAVVSAVFTEFCRTDADDVSAVSVARGASESALTFARAVVSTQAACVSTGNAFGCASATALAEAWASAIAEAHTTAVAASAEECDCLATSQGLSVGTASTFITLAADAFARTEVTACSEGNSVSFASAFADCAALAYATVWTKAVAEALLEGDCFSSDVATRIIAQTSGAFGVIEGCERDGFSLGDAFASTDGSTAEGLAEDHS